MKSLSNYLIKEDSDIKGEPTRKCIVYKDDEIIIKYDPKAQTLTIYDENKRCQGLFDCSHYKTWKSVKTAVKKEWGIELEK